MVCAWRSCCSTLLCEEGEGEFCKKHCQNIIHFSHCVEYYCERPSHKGSIYCEVHCMKEGHRHCAFSYKKNLTKKEIKIALKFIAETDWICGIHPS